MTANYHSLKDNTFT